MALSDGKCRIRQKSFFEEIEICLLFQILRIVFDQTEYQFLNQINARKQNHDCCQTENRVHHGDLDRAHRHIQKLKVYKSIDTVKDNRPENHTEQIVQQINQGCTFSVFICTDGRKQYRAGRSYSNSHRNRKCCRKTDTSGHGQCLQNTNGCGSTL